MQQMLDVLLRTFDLNLGKYSISPSYWQAGAIVFLLFILVLTMAQVRRHFLDWTAKGAIIGLFFGFLLTLILEGFLMLSGKTVLSLILGWKTAPKPISNVLDAGRNNLVRVLGTHDIVNINLDTVTSGYQSLNPNDQKKFRSSVCMPH